MTTLVANSAVTMNDPLSWSALLSWLAVGTSTSTAFTTQNSTNHGEWDFAGVGFGDFSYGIPLSGRRQGHG
jgi:hypothetical protein